MKQQSMSDEEIKIGGEVLDYIAELGRIQEELQTAYVYAESCKANVDTGTSYKGKATEEMQLFFSSLASNLQRMLFLYQAATAYATNAYKTMYYNEEQIVDWVINQMGEGNEVCTTK